MNEARARQISLYELNEGINPAPVLKILNTQVIFKVQPGVKEHFRNLFKKSKNKLETQMKL